MTTTHQPSETQEAWDAIAAGYDEYVTPTHFDLGGEALRRAGLERGQSFLDVAAGSGALSLPAARAGARVTATDLSPAMLARLDARSAAEGLRDVETRVMDGHALELQDGSFDVVGSQYGVMLFPDLPRAVSEMARIAKPGGRLVLVVYGPPTQVEFLGFFLGAVQRVVPGFEGLPADPPPLPFQVSDPARLRGALESAGLRDVGVETLVQRTTFDSGTHLWNWVVNSNPIGRMMVAGLSDEQTEDVRAVLDELVRERAGGSGPAVLTDPNHIGVGTVVGA